MDYREKIFKSSLFFVNTGRLIPKQLTKKKVKSIIIKLTWRIIEVFRK